MLESSAVTSLGHNVNNGRSKASLLSQQLYASNYSQLSQDNIVSSTHIIRRAVNHQFHCDSILYWFVEQEYNLIQTCKRKVVGLKLKQVCHQNKIKMRTCPLLFTQWQYCSSLIDLSTHNRLFACVVTSVPPYFHPFSWLKGFGTAPTFSRKDSGVVPEDAA